MVSDDDPINHAVAPAPPPRASGRAVWHAVRPYVHTHRRALVLGGGLSLATGAAGLALPLVVRELIAALGDSRSVARLLGLMTVLVVANAGIGALGGYVLARVGESVVRDVRRGLLAHLVRLRVSAVESTEPGDLMARVTADTTLVRQVVTDSLLQAITGTLTLVATVVLMAVVDGVLLVVTSAVLAVAAIVIGVVVPRINRASRAAQESVGMIGAALERVFGAYRTVKAAGAEERETARLFAAADAARDAGVRAALWSSVAGNTAGLAIQGAFVAVLTVGGARAASGATDIGTLIAFLLYVFYLMAPIQQLVSAVTQFQIGAAAVQRILEAEALPAEDGRPGTSAGRVDAPAVVFDHVGFRYDDGLPAVHHDVSFRVPRGGTTAFVGPSGAGKTTIFSLLERFYQPTTGRVLVDGVDVGDWDLAALRQTIGYVEQDAPVLSGTLRENIVFAMPDAGADDVARVVTTARLDQLLARSPDGLDTLVGHRGIKLSGGERQRVAIARALLRGPQLLLLDEATSQLDAINEAALRDTVRDVARSATVLIVAHRLSTVVLADRIVVIDAGRVRAVGPHAELITSDALYAELAATQLLSGVD